MARRPPSLPDAQTMAKAGLPEYIEEQWFGVCRSKGILAPIVQNWQHFLLEAIKWASERPGPSSKAET